MILACLTRPPWRACSWQVDELLFTDDVQEAFEYIVRALEAGPGEGESEAVDASQTA